ncbi:MAG: hypothetical protein K2W82_15720 [Candidatus Obscuribacterales bacterium]|jgi:hypothetical protein|nr:hypothetical protein [Candidatus Obscuribacterales bacterium]
MNKLILSLALAAGLICSGTAMANGPHGHHHGGGFSHGGSHHHHHGGYASGYRPGGVSIGIGGGFGIGVGNGGVRIGIGSGYNPGYGYGYNPYTNGRYGGYRPYPGYITVWVNDVVVNYTVSRLPNGQIVQVPVYSYQRRLVTAQWDSVRGGYWYWNGARQYVRAQ